MATFNAGVDNAFADIDRQRMALQHYVSAEREALVAQAQQAADDAIAKTLAALPALVGKVVFWIVLLVAALVGGFPSCWASGRAAGANGHAAARPIARNRSSRHPSEPRFAVASAAVGSVCAAAQQRESSTVGTSKRIITDFIVFFAGVKGKAMARRKQNYPLIEGLEITTLAAEGKAMGRWQDQVVFVPMTVPGDVVDVQIRNRRRRFMEGTVVRYVHRSPLRVEPFCAHFGVCGGCKWQNLPYAEQLRFKTEQVRDQLARIGKVELPEIRPACPRPKPVFTATSWSSPSHRAAG